jgi:glutaredoxin 3
MVQTILTFFENRVTEYEVAGLSGNWDDAYEAVD